MSKAIEKKDLDEAVKEEWIRFRVPPKMKNEWLALCKSRDESEAELGRRLVKKAIEQGGVETALDEIVSIIRIAMKDVMKPNIERLASIESKTSISSATAMYMLTQVLHNQGEDAMQLYEDARKKAINFVKTKVDSNE